MISFQSLSYYIFAFVVFMFFQFAHKKKRPIILLIFNLIFAALFFYFSKKNLVLLMVYITTSYGLIYLSNRYRTKKIFIFLQLGLSICFLMFFKYDFISTSFTQAFPALHFLSSGASFAGLSFLCFRSLSLMFDNLYESRENELSFIHYTNFLLFFPCYLSGPLDRYDRFVDDFKDDQRISSEQLYLAISRIIYGAFKKGVIADTLYDFSSDSMNITDFETMQVSKIFVSHYVYMFVLYFDFSGYSDIAIGVSKLFGIQTPENFNRPYLQRNI